MKMKKNKLKGLLFSSLFLLFSIAANISFAQCSFNTVDESGNPVTVSVSCDFPVRMDTGNPEADDATYSEALSTWIPANLSSSDLWNPRAYFEITQADFDTMSSERQTAISSNGFYHIIP
jgi:hypothetical protein